MALEQQFRLDGKCAAITGAASGIGRAIATAFADVGARLFLMDINGAALEQAADALPGDVRTHAVDVTDPDAVNVASEVCGQADILTDLPNALATVPFRNQRVGTKIGDGLLPTS